MKKQRLTNDERKLFPISKNSNVKYGKGKIYEYTVDEMKLNSLLKLFGQRKIFLRNKSI
jgi:hypothetical protein